MKINTIETAIYSEPDEQNRVKLLGMRKAEDVFLQLFSHLQENNLLPDEYFIFKKENFEYNDGELPKDCSFSSHTEYGGSEGIYISITVYDEKLDKHIGFATGKTLEDNATAYLRMSRIGAECELMLNNEGYPIEYNELKGYKLNQNEKTIYTIVEQHKNTALLQRHIANSSGDPTPYIVAYVLKIKENNIIEWDSGKYCSSISGAVQEIRESNSLLNEKSDNIEVDGYYGTWYVIDKIEYESKEYFLLEHEEYGDEAANIIVDNNTEIVLDNVYNGFNDLFEFLDCTHTNSYLQQQGNTNKSEQIFTYVTDNDPSEISNSTFKSILEEPQAKFPPKGKAIATRIPEPRKEVTGSPLSKEKTKESENKYDNNPTIDFGIF